MRFVYESFAQAMNHLGDAKLWSATWRTLWLASGSTVVALLLGLPIGVAIGQARPRVRRTGFTLANAGLGLPPVVLGVFLALLLTSNPLAQLGWIDTLRGMFLAQVLLSLPLVVALTATAVAGLPAGLLEQARAFGAGRLARGLLALREARIGVLTAVIAALGSAVAEVGAVGIIGGNIEGHTDTLAGAVLLDLSASDAASATADVIVLLAIVVLLGSVLTVAQQRHRREPGG